MSIASVNVVPAKRMHQSIIQVVGTGMGIDISDMVILYRYWKTFVLEGLKFDQLFTHM